jgi:hypothetical protein
MLKQVVWNREKQTTCIGCGDIPTPWQDGVCSHCSETAPNHICSSQLRKFYLLKRRKRELLKKTVNTKTRTTAIT